jgi:hypothetical protein
MSTKMTDIEMSASHAAEYVAKHIGDGRDYSRKLADMRRGRGSYGLPFHKDSAGRAYYYVSDLDQFIAFETQRVRAVKPIKKVERYDGALGSLLPPSRVVGIVN